MLYRRAKTSRGKRHLKGREPRMRENPKQIFYLHGTKCPQLVQHIFKDWVRAALRRARTDGPVAAAVHFELT